MKKDIAQRWIQALRSGEYKQGKKCLRSASDHFCCLGVLVDLYAKEFGIKWEIHDEGHRYFELLGDTGVLPREVGQWSEIYSVGGYLRAEKKSLTTFNDHEGKTFLEIADIIEKNFEEL